MERFSYALFFIVGFVAHTLALAFEGYLIVQVLLSVVAVAGFAVAGAIWGRERAVTEFNEVFEEFRGYVQ